MNPNNEEQNNGSTEPQNDLKTKIKSFLDEYKLLVEKHGIDFATYPVWLPDGAGAFKCVIQNTPVDISKKPSPLVKDA